MTDPAVSISIITYNQAAFIAEAVESAADQAYDNLQVVVADDGSTDGTAERILQLAHKYPGRVLPLTGGPNLGITGNSNRALRACTGKYVAFQGGDDVLLPGKIRAQVDWLESDPRRVLCGHDVEVFLSETGESLGRLSSRSRMEAGSGAAHVVRVGVPFCATAIMVRADSIPPWGFDERLPIVSDWKLWIDCLANGGAFGFVDGVHARYRRHSGNITGVLRDLHRDDLFTTIALVESSHPELAGACRVARSRLFITAGGAALRIGNRRRARAYFASAIRQRPLWPLKGIMAMVLAMLPEAFAADLMRKVRAGYESRR